MITQRKNVILLMTACINPNGMSNTALQNKELRRMQYLKAVDFYLSQTPFKILFVENSGEDISEQYKNEIKEGRMEVITFRGNEYEKSLGKGFGEGLIIKKAISSSKYIDDKTVICKVSGRHIVKNINTIYKASRFFTKNKNFIICDINRKTGGGNF